MTENLLFLNFNLLFKELFVNRQYADNKVKDSVTISQ